MTDDPPSRPEDSPTAGVTPPDGGARAAAGRLLSGTSWQTTAQVLPLLVNLAMTPWVIHGLGGERYSVFLLVTAVVTVLSTLDGGIGESSLRFFTLYAGRDDRIATTRLLTSVSAVIVGISVVVTVAVLAGSRPLLEFFGLDSSLFPEGQALLFVMVPITGVLFLRNLYSSVVFARQRFAIMAIARLAGQAAYILVVVLTVLLDWKLYGIAAAQVAQGVVLGLVSVPTGLQYLDRRGVRLMSWPEFSEFFRYAWRVQVSGVVNLVIQQKDQLVAGRVLTAQASGPFGQGTSFATQVGLMPYNAIAPIQAMTGQRVGRMGAAAAAPSVEAVQSVWVKAVTGWCLVGAPAAYVGVRAWLPDSYATAGLVAAVLLLGNVFWLMSTVTVIWALTLGHPEIEMRANLTSLLTNLVLSVTLFPLVGMMGIVGATALGRMAAMLSVSRDARRLPTRLRWFVRDVPPLAAVVGFGSSVLLGSLASPHLPRGPVGLLSAGLVALVPMLAYAALAFPPSQWRRGWAWVRRRG